MRALATSLVLAAWALLPVRAWAFEPYTHNFTADQARADALDGSVSIDGRGYPVRAELLQALRAWPQYYDAGVIGPDIYPDLLYGWNLIHTSDGSDAYGCETVAPHPPELLQPLPPSCVQSGDTGEWLELVLDRAWAVQDDPRYGTQERTQVLAFTYGFLTHAAGDLWAHTFVNDFAQQLWPPMSEIATDVEALKVALRHKGVEAYVGDATPYYDGNPDRTALPDGDISDVATPSRRFDAPHRFLYETMIASHAPTPTPERELTLSFFLNLRAKLVELRDDLPPPIDPLGTLLAEHDRIQGVLDAAEGPCVEGTDGGVLADAAACLAALASLTAQQLVTRLDFESFRDAERLRIGRRILARYVVDWIAAIDDGLVHWSELSLALNRAYFDAQVRRDLQNRPSDPGCGSRGVDALSGPRADCEDAISSRTVILDATNDFVNEYLLEMLGAPQLFGELRAIRQRFRALFDEALGRLIAPGLLIYNPLAETVDELRDRARAKILEHLMSRFGVEVDELEEFAEGASHWLALESVSITTPGLGERTFTLFEPGDHARVDALIGVSDGDEPVFDPIRFAPLANTITLAKLLLLDGPTLDRALGDLLVARGLLEDAGSVQTYSAREGDSPANVMVDALTGPPWLRSITSDHSWRVDPLAVDFFAFDHVRGGTGQFPLWESCVLRPAFRALFTDWENAMQSFPDLGDAPSADPASDPEAPQVALAIEGRSFNDGTTQYVGRSNRLRLHADDVAGFTQEHVALRWRVRARDAEPGEFVEVATTAEFSIEGPDGEYLIEYQTQDPCHTFANEGGDDAADPLPPGELRTIEVTLAHIGTERNDEIWGTKGDDIVLGLGGNDRINGRGGNDEIHGGLGRDSLRGGDGDDWIDGGQGNDHLRGGNGDDEILGGPGDDALAGEKGNDTLLGHDGNDRLIGREGNDTLLGHDGNDKLDGGRGDDALDGGSGTDRLMGGSGVDSCAAAEGRLRGCESRS